MSNEITVWDEADKFIYGTFKNKLEMHNHFRERFKFINTYSDKEFEIHNPLGNLNDENYLNNEINEYLCQFGLQIKEKDMANQWGTYIEQSINKEND